MYINLENFSKLLKSPKTICLLILLSRASKKDVSLEIEGLNFEIEELNELEDTGWITYIKGTKKQTASQKMRLSKKGKTWVKSLSKTEVLQEDIYMEKWLHDVYSQRPNFHKSNRKQTQRLIADFREKTGIEKNKLAVLFLCFLNDTFVTNITDNKKFWEAFNKEKEINPRLQISNKLENLIWKSDNERARSFKIEESKLYSYYEEFQEHVDLQYGLKLEEARKKKLAEEKN